MLNNNNSGSGTFENHFQDETGESLIKQTVAQLEALNANYINLEAKLNSLE